MDVQPTSGSGFPRWADRRYGSSVPFRILGPVEASGGSGPINLGGPKQRLVLAHLVLGANHVVPIERLIDAVWGEDPPGSARGTLQAYVSRLRGALGAERIEGRPPGYLFRAEPEEIDALRLDVLLRDARLQLSSDPETAAALFAEAEALWRGPALADLASEPSLAGEIARLEELRRSAAEDRIAAELELGRHVELVGELEALTTSDPLRERLWGQLMLALYRSGRQAEALAAFGRAYQRLAEELGLDPSQELQLLHERILRHDEALDVPGVPLRGYRLLETVGEGPSGIVYRAIQPQIGREVAIKVIGSNQASDPDFVRAFESEAQIVARLEHPHVVPLYDYWRDRDGAYLVMRFMRGGSLREALASGSIISERALRAADQIAQALDAAHRVGVVHRDVKPENVLLDEEGNAYLSDFAVARDVAGDGAVEPGTNSTYLSPERRSGAGGPATPASDVYALGAVLREALHDDAPGPVADVLARATAEDVTRRFPDATSLAAALGAALGGRHLPLIREETRNPYKGLRSFTEADAGDFFGRDALVERLLARLAEDVEGSRFLAVVGPSGSGKSSAVRAGLVPALRGGALDASSGWFYVEMTPGSHPLEELEAALLRVAVNPPTSLIEQLERDAHGLLRAVKRVLPNDEAELLLVVDQLEELFTLTEDDALRRHLLESLRTAVSYPRSPVRIVATLRADHYDRPLAYRGFAELIRARTESIVPLAPDELERAISGPAELAGVLPEPALVADIVADVVDQPGALPLLQYALTELYDRRSDGRLTLERYREIGGVGGALAAKAEHLYATRPPVGQEAVRQLFLRLVALGEGTADTRRRVPVAELLALEVERGTMESAIDDYGRHRFIMFDHDLATRGPTVEVAHEALLGAWARLRGWIEEARDEVRLHRRLSDATGEWERSGQDQSFLLTGARLDRFETWASATSLALAPGERTYLESSVARRKEERAAEEARRGRELVFERRSVRRLRAFVAVLGVAALVGGALTVVARNQRERAQHESRIATARELSAASGASLDDDVDQSLLLAIEAVATTYGPDGTVLPEAEEALHLAVQADRLLQTFPATGNARFSPDGSRLLTVGVESGTAVVYDLENDKEVLTIRGHGEGDLAGATYSPDGRMIATASYPEGSTKVWDSNTGDELMTFADPAGGRVCCAAEFLPDGSVIATQVFRPDSTCCMTGFYSLETGRELPHLRIDWSGALRFSPDGRRLAISNCVIGWRRSHGRQDPTCAPDHPDSSPSAVSWSPDGSRVATSFWDGTTTVWDPDSGEEITTLDPGSPGFALDVDFSRVGSRLAMGLTDGSVWVWDLDVVGSTAALLLPGHSEGVGAVTFSQDGTKLASASSNTAKVWDVTPSGGEEWATVAGSGGFGYSPDGRWIAIGHHNTVRLYDADSGEISRVFTADRQVLGATFDPGGDRLAAGTTGGSILVWDVEAGDELLSLEGHDRNDVLDVAFSPDGHLLASTSAVVLGSSSEGARIGSTELWDAASGRTVHTLDGGGQSLAFSPDGALVAVTSSGGSNSKEQRILISDVASGARIRILNNHLRVNAVAFSPDGSEIVAGGLDGKLRAWDPETGQPLGTMEGNLSQIWDISFSPDGGRLATSSDDGTVRIWDPVGQRQLFTIAREDLTAGFNAGFDVGFSPDGTRLASTAADGRLRVFVLPIGELLEMARGHVGRTFTDQECRQYLHTAACPS